MIYHFRVISNEVDDFIFDLAIDSNQLFIDLHTYIQQELGFDPSQLTSFFITDDEWNKEIEITQLDMLGNSDLIRVMDQVKLEELLTQAKQRLLYAFDLLTDRVLFMELTEIKAGSLATCSTLRREGANPPPVVEDPLFGADDEYNEEFNSYEGDAEDLDWDNDQEAGDYHEEPDDHEFY
jgi:hypothetical protein